MVQNERRRCSLSFLTYGTLGIEMGVSLAIGLAIGYYLDRHFGTSPILTLIFMGFRPGCRNEAPLRALEKDGKGR